MVIFPSPCFWYNAGLQHGVKDLSVQELVPELTYEQLHITIFLGASWFDKQGPDSGASRPLLHRFSRELRAMSNSGTGVNENNPVAPGLFPRSALPPQVQPSERKVHEALASALPSGWSAWHSLKIRVKAGDFSEADFVIADPARGILVLEVKGGIVSKRDGVWFQNERPMKMLPLDQAHRFIRVLLGKLGVRELARGREPVVRRQGPGSQACTSRRGAVRGARKRQQEQPRPRLAAESGALWKNGGFDTVIVDEGQDS